ncbi:beta-lactamase family protein [Glaciecola sp. XM2]|uniref:serine hydrolase n=1 Tax=Glaciecola sp. XM2 TaxID=1914931 RepID=UPI001BDF1E16|nr:serine hydrolase [Glaciecola sp. XM2]MBT1450614.1 beta-lactamase family protein [Glaciecola sp. XM2]
MKYFVVLILIFSSSNLAAQLDSKALDAVIEDALSTFHTPGMSVSIVYQQQVIYEKGFGKANIAEHQDVRPDTYFRLASTSKAFTAASLALLVDQEKLDWQDLVIDYLPHFRLHDSYATEHFTIEDLLTHKSGLVGGAGDSMIWPEPSGFSREEVVSNVKYLTPGSQFREQYAYSNVMYITAGEVVEAVSGKPFEDFVDQYIFKPLGMQCYAGDMPKATLQNSAMAYGHNDRLGVYEIPRNAIHGDALMSAAAGGMVCSASEMSKWIKALLQPSQLPFSEEQLEKMWQPHTILGVSDVDTEWDNTYFRNYGLGWRLSNYDGYLHISHTGTLSGYQAFVVVMPQLELGVVVLNNGSNYGARGAVMQSILKMFTGDTKDNWVEQYVDYQAEREAIFLARDDTPESLAPSSLNDEQIVGVYSDQWFGDFTISKQGDELRIVSSRMENLKGTLSAFQDTSYKIDWDNENAASDAFIHFDINVKREVLSATLHPFTTRELTSHEWRDMHFIKQ